MPFTQLYYHVVWATKCRDPILFPQIEPIITTIIRTKAIYLNAYIHAINGAYDHLHLVVSIPPTIAVAKFIGQLKGVSSAKLNQIHPGNPFYWQKEYGVVSIDMRNLSFVIWYVEEQKQHHAANKTISRLETFPTFE